LGKALGRPTNLLPMASFGAMIDAQVEQRIDGGFYSAAAFALAEAECRCLEPIAAPAASDGTVAYRAVIVARRSSGIASSADLEGKTVAVGAADSVGARRMQFAGLTAEGFDPSRFGAVREAASAEAAVRMLVGGEADAAFAWSSLRGDAAAGTSRGTLADLAAHGEITPDEFTVVWQSPPIAHGPVAVTSSLPAAEKAAIRSYLLGLANSEPAAYDALDPYYGGGYVAIEPKDYAAVELLASDRPSTAEPSAASPDAEPAAGGTGGRQ
jgi:phosphonate transport system substrate-binding protein